jgi:hypothetical protein
MRKELLAVTILAGTVISAGLSGTSPVRASEPYEKVTKLKCEHCHEHNKEQLAKMSDYEATRDLTKKCGKESLEFLKKQPGFKELKPGEERSDAEAKKWALAFARAKWKCSEEPK